MGECHRQQRDGFVHEGAQVAADQLELDQHRDRRVYADLMIGRGVTPDSELAAIT